MANRAERHVHLRDTPQGGSASPAGPLRTGQTAAGPCDPAGPPRPGSRAGADPVATDGDRTHATIAAWHRRTSNDSVRCGPRHRPCRRRLEPGRAAHVAPALGLLAHVVELDRDTRRGDGLLLGRMSYDLLGTIPVDVVETSVRVVRPGRTIELVEAVLRHEGRDGVVLRAWLLRRGRHDGHRRWGARADRRARRDGAVGPDDGVAGWLHRVGRRAPAPSSTPVAPGSGCAPRSP